MKKKNKESKRKGEDHASPIFQIMIVFAAFAALIGLTGFENSYLEIAKRAIFIITILYLIYRINLLKILFGFDEGNISKVLFGINHKDLDLLAIFSFVALSFRDMISFVIGPDPANIFFGSVVQNLVLIDKISFFIGALLLIIVSVFIASKIESNKPSFLKLFHKAPKKIDTPLLIRRFLLVFFFLSAIFLFIFSPALKLSMLMSSYNILLLIAAAYCFILIFDFKKKDRKIIPYRIKEHSDNFYDNFIKLFYDKSKISMAIGGIFVFNVFVNFMLFMIPYFLGNAVVGSSMPLSQLLLEDVSSAYDNGMLMIAAIIVVYILNILCFTALMFSPAIIWHKLFKRRDYNINEILFCIFIFSAVVFMMVPIFKIIPSGSRSQMIGMDIITDPVYDGTARIYLALIAGLILGVMAYIFCRDKMAKKSMVGLALVFIDTFIGIYLVYYVISIFSAYIKNFYFAYSNGNFLASIFFTIFLIISVIFYFAGFIAFVVETIKEYKHIHLSKYR